MKKYPSPPYLSTWFLNKFCTKDLIEEIQGDLHEQFLDHVDQYGETKAKRIYSWTILRSLRLYLIKTPKTKKYSINQFDMFKNYLKIAFRNLVKQKRYTLTNIFGLTTGVVSVFLILIFIDSELSYDKHHPGVERLYRVATDMKINDENLNLATSPPGLAVRLKEEFPEVEAITRISAFIQVSKNIFQKGEKQIFESNGYFADSTYFDLFNYNFLYGTPSNALYGPQKIVLSKTLYQKFFKDENPLGETITIANNYGKSEYIITGVIDENAMNTHMRPNFICSMNSGVIGRFIYGSDEMAGNNFLYTYARLVPGADPKDFDSKVPQFIDKHLGDVIKQFGAEKNHYLQKVSDIHLKSKLLGDSPTNGSIRYIYMLLSIAVFILVIACINFMNMATAQSAQRAREIGVRKVFGAFRMSLVYQFLGEAAAITFASIVLSVIVAYQVLPFFNELVDRNLSLNLASNLNYIYMIVGLGIITSLLAGSYPALYLSSLKTISVVKGHQTKSGGGLFVRKGLVIFQFVIAITLIIGVITIQSQMDFIRQRSLGFQKENKLIVPLQSAQGIAQFDMVKNSFSEISEVKTAAGLSFYPGEFIISDNLYFKEGATAEQAVRIQRNHVDYQLIESLKIELLYGRTFDENRPTDPGNTIVMNETAVKGVGYEPQQAIGRKIFAPNDTSNLGLTIIGVIKDFNFMSLHEKITPYAFTMRNDRSFPYILIDTQTSDYTSLIDQLEDKWEAALPDIPFEYFFLDNNLNKLYDSDRNFSRIIATFTIIAIIICALGLFGLSAFTTEQRIKEIGIRKVLGASVPSILLMLSKSFTVLVFFAFLIAAPMGWFLMNKWLEAFAFKIEISAFILIISGVLALLFTILVVSYQSLRAATSNPAETLKNE